MVRTLRPLREGGLFRIVAPSGYVRSEAVEACVLALRQRGYTVEVGSSVGARSSLNPYLAGDDELRLQELMGALRDDRVDVVLCARGGYGAMRLLDRVPRGEWAQVNKHLVGFSDITCLSLALLAENVPSIHGPLAVMLGEERQSWAMDQLLSALRGESVTFRGLNPLRSGDAEGPMVGGNVCILAANLMRFSHLLADSILFLEDVGEPAYRLDRMLTSLGLAGVFQQVKAVVLGDFAAKDDHYCDAGSARRMVEQRVLDLTPARTPVYTGLPVGHIDANASIPVGAMATLCDGSLHIWERDA